MTKPLRLLLLLTASALALLLLGLLLNYALQTFAWKPATSRPQPVQRLPTASDRITLVPTLLEAPVGRIIEDPLGNLFLLAGKDRQLLKFDGKTFAPHNPFDYKVLNSAYFAHNGTLLLATQHDFILASADRVIARETLLADLIRSNLPAFIDAFSKPTKNLSIRHPPIAPLGNSAVLYHKGSKLFLIHSDGVEDITSKIPINFSSIVSLRKVGDAVFVNASGSDNAHLVTSVGGSNSPASSLQFKPVPPVHGRDEDSIFPTSDSLWITTCTLDTSFDPPTQRDHAAVLLNSTGEIRRIPNAKTLFVDAQDNLFYLDTSSKSVRIASPHSNQTTPLQISARTSYSNTWHFLQASDNSVLIHTPEGLLRITLAAGVPTLTHTFVLDEIPANLKSIHLTRQNQILVPITYPTKSTDHFLFQLPPF